MNSLVAITTRYIGFTMDNQNNHDDQDLYGDLSETKAAVAANEGPQEASNDRKRPRSSQSSSSAVRPRSLHEQVEFLEQKVNSLQAENENLKRNVGILYRTAKAEIERKDNEIESLMKQVESQT